MAVAGSRGDALGGAAVEADDGTAAAARAGAGRRVGVRVLGGRPSTSATGAAAVRLCFRSSAATAEAAPISGVLRRRLRSPDARAAPAATASAPRPTDRGAGRRPFAAADRRDDESGTTRPSTASSSLTRPSPAE
jgi:hypothetical protein